MMCQQIMMEGCFLSTPDATIAMCSFLMNRVGEAFADDTPLKGELTVIIESGTFIRTPAQRAMVYDYVTVSFGTVHCIVTFLLDVRSHT